MTSTSWATWPARFALLSQTTLSLDEWQDLREYAEVKFPEIWMPNRSDLCFATTNRQAALRTIAAEADAVVVIGSANSSNTVALTKVAEAVGLPAGPARQRRLRTARRPAGHRRGHGRRVGARVARERGARGTQPHQRRHVASVTVEDEYFPPPPELREMLKTLSALLDLIAGDARHVEFRRGGRPQLHRRRGAVGRESLSLGRRAHAD